MNGKLLVKPIIHYLAQQLTITNLHLGWIPIRFIDEGVGDMKKTVTILFVAALLFNGASQGEGKADLSKNALSLETELQLPAITSSASNLNRGFLKQNKIAIGTVLQSHHFDKYDYHDYNESHNGIYLNINRWSTGVFQNSADVQSVFITYNPTLYTNKSFVVNLVTGIANGYEGWEYAQGDYIPILGVSAQWTYLKTMLSYEAIAFGIELPLN